MKIDILVFDGAEDLDFVPPQEILSRGGQAAGVEDLTVRLVSPTAQKELRTAHGMRLIPHGTVDENCDVLIISGGGWVANNGQGIRALAGNENLLEMLQRMHHRGTLLVGICTGAMLLAQAGILAGRRATTHYAAQTALAEYGVKMVRARVVDDGDVITCGAVTASLDTAFWMVERFWGKHVANTTARIIDYQPTTDVTKPCHVASKISKPCHQIPG